MCHHKCLRLQDLCLHHHKINIQRCLCGYNLPELVLEFEFLVLGRYKNGQMESERYYKKGVQSGTERHWYDNGQKRWEMIYQNGRMISMKAWSIDGNEQKKKP